MFCKYCGQEIADDSSFCPRCGKSIKESSYDSNEDVRNLYSSVFKQKKEEKGSFSIAALILGITGLVGWTFPLLGFPIVITGLILGLIGRNRAKKKIALWGIILCIVALILTTANSAIGAYKGYHGLLDFQKNSSSKTVGDNTFTLRDSDGNILMTDGIKAAEVISVENDMGTNEYYVQIQFTDEGTEKFYDITNTYCGERIGMYLNDNMLSNPTVGAVITDGLCHINMTTYEEAKEIVDLLNSINE